MMSEGGGEELGGKSKRRTPESIGIIGKDWSYLENNTKIERGA